MQEEGYRSGLERRHEDVLAPYLKQGIKQQGQQGDIRGPEAGFTARDGGSDRKDFPAEDDERRE